MNIFNKMTVSLLFAGLICCPSLHSINNDFFAGLGTGATIIVVGVLIKNLLERKPLDLHGSMYRENMRPKDGCELECRAIVRYLELLDHGLTLDDKQGPSETKAKLGIEKIAYLEKYNQKCNTTPNSRTPF